MRRYWYIMFRILAMPLEQVTKVFNSSPILKTNCAPPATTPRHPNSTQNEADSSPLILPSKSSYEDPLIRTRTSSTHQNACASLLERRHGKRGPSYPDCIAWAKSRLGLVNWLHSLAMSLSTWVCCSATAVFRRGWK